MANTTLVYAYNTWYPCTVHVFVYTLYVHAMYIHVLTSCLNMVGRVPLIPLLLAGNSSPTIHHQFSQHKMSGFQVGSCDNAAAHGQLGSNVYEVKPDCGRLYVASSAWVVCQLKRLMTGRRLLRRRGSCAKLRLAASQG